uniref:NADH dehydrogenase subunit 3 n=1 Tax=Mansonella ozzardi TaxID=122354 RepID=UPI00286AE76A|nr:NADH dehydrogenase subunit 3 [Mansonella ozzardi]WLE64579.1 NADH dehydrogenase subunit 3 [Mansonella ozzardi]WLV27615.1 NADH dehydrogenase subunit 3 [Mansonella ozzardi]
MFLNFIVIFFFSFLVPFFMFFFSLMISYRDFFDDKLGSYECGFVVPSLMLGFNVVFFSIILMFIVFELEVVIFIMLIGSDFYSVLSFFFFFVYIVFSFYLEWYFGKLTWFF